MRREYLLIIVGISVLFASLGLGRFVFGMVLPDLKSDLGLTVTESGFLSTGNFVGYLAGLLFSGVFYSKIGALRLIFFSLIGQSLSMFLMLLFDSYPIIIFFYLVCGFFGALSTIAIMSHITQSVGKDIRGKAAGILYMGSGSAIVLSGYLVPFVDRFYGDCSWRAVWGIFALITALVSLVVKFSLQEDLPLSTQIVQKSSIRRLIGDKRFLLIGGLYFCFGITYVVFVTFFVLASMQKWGISSYLSADFWIVLGFLSIFSGPIFGILSDKIGRFKTLSIVFFIQSIANLIMALSLPQFSLWFSAFFFGISVWATPSIMAVVTAETFGIEKTASIFSKITLVFAIGQIIGPIGAGYAADLAGGFSYSFGFSFCVAFFGFILSSYLAREI